MNKANLPLTVTIDDWKKAMAATSNNRYHRCSLCVIAQAIHRTYPAMGDIKVGLLTTYRTNEQGADIGDVHKLSPELLNMRRAFDALTTPVFPGEVSGVLIAV